MSNEKETVGFDCGNPWLPVHERPSHRPPFWPKEQCSDRSKEDVFNRCPVSGTCKGGYAYGPSDGNCMICSLDSSGAVPRSSNTGSRLYEFDLTQGVVAFDGEIQVTSSATGYSVTSTVSPLPLLGHVFEYRPIYEWTAERPERNPRLNFLGDPDVCRGYTQSGYNFLIAEDGRCKYYSATSGRPSALGSFKLTDATDLRLQLRPGIVVTGTVPTPQSELSGFSSFGQFVWRGTIYRTADVDGRAFISKRRLS